MYRNVVKKVRHYQFSSQREMFLSFIFVVSPWGDECWLNLLRLSVHNVRKSNHRTAHLKCIQWVHWLFLNKTGKNTFSNCVRNKSRSRSVGHGRPFIYTMEWEFSLVPFLSRTINAKFTGSISRSSKTVRGSPCPAPVGGLGPSEPAVLGSNFIHLLRPTLFFFMRPQLKELPRMLGGGHSLCLECWWQSLFFIRKWWIPVDSVAPGSWGEVGEWGEENV